MSSPIYALHRRHFKEVVSWLVSGAHVKHPTNQSGLPISRVAHHFFKRVTFAFQHQQAVSMLTRQIGNVTINESCGPIVKGLWLCLWELWHSLVLITECHNSHKHSQSLLTKYIYNQIVRSNSSSNVHISVIEHLCIGNCVQLLQKATHLSKNWRWHE